ncbi:hypothetical protein MASR2M12_21590 [Bacteroidales bacterium]
MESINDKMLNNAAILFVATIVIVILGQWWLAPSYALPNEKVLTRITDSQTLVLPGELITAAPESYTALILSDKPKASAFPSAKKIVIPFAKLLDKKNLKSIPTEGMVFIFGENESQALMALELLTAKGFDNLRAVANDLRTNQTVLTNGIEPKAAFRKGEKAVYDYSRFFKTNNAKAQPAAQPETVTIKAKGGCS